MIRNRNGYWMFPGFMSPDDGGSAGGEGNPGGEAGAAGNDQAGSNVADNASGENGNAEEAGKGNDVDALNAEIARLKADAAKQKAALDKATKEAGEARKALKAKMTAEEIAAQEKEAADEAQKNRIIELEKQVARTETVKSVMGTLGLDEETSGSIADCLFGASDIKSALLLFQKAWQARETALKKEYGKITGPGAGNDPNSPESQAVKRAAEIGKARNAQNEQAQKALNAYIR